MCDFRSQHAVTKDLWELYSHIELVRGELLSYSYHTSSFLHFSSSVEQEVEKLRDTGLVAGRSRPKSIFYLCKLWQLFYLLKPLNLNCKTGMLTDYHIVIIYIYSTMLLLILPKILA